MRWSMKVRDVSRCRQLRSKDVTSGARKNIGHATSFVTEAEAVSALEAQHMRYACLNEKATRSYVYASPFSSYVC